jgi:hypothetical protein
VVVAAKVAPQERVAQVAVVRGQPTQVLAQQERQTLAAAAVAVAKLATAAQAAAVLSLCALRVPTHLLTVQPQSVEQPREHTPLAALTTLTTRSIRQAH